MTIASQTSRIAYNGDSSTTAFAIPFFFAANSDLVVILQDSDGNQTTQVLGTNYTLAGATLSTGGTCTFTTAPATGYLVTIYRDPPVTQEASYNNNDPFPAKSHENALDKLTTIAQRLKDLYSRTIRLSDGEAQITTTLATPAIRKNKLFGFGTDGELIYPAGPTFVNGTYTGVADIDTRATAAVTTFPVSVTVIRTSGLATVGDGGGQTYKKGTGANSFTDGSGTSWIPVADKNVGSVVISTQAVAATLAFPSHVLYIIVGGTTTVGDGGAATYKRGTGSDSFTDAGGTVWAPILASTATGSSLLQPLPMLARPKVALFGDSTMMGSNVATVIISAGVYPNAYPRNLHRSGKGFASWAAAYSLGRWTWNVRYDPGEGDSGKFFSGDNMAFAGEDTATILLRLRRGLRLMQPQIAIFACGINDLQAGSPSSIVDTMLDRFTQMAALCLANGCYPVFTTLPGRSPPGTVWPIDITAAGLPDPGWPVGDSRYTYRTSINTGLKALASGSSGTIFCVDFESIYVDSGTGYWVTKGSDDGVHPSQYVNRRAGKKLADDVLNSMISPLPTQFSYDINVSSFNYLTTGCDPTFNTTGGTPGSGCTTLGATIGQGWTIGLLSAGSCTVATSIVNPGGGVSYKSQRMVFTMAGANIYERFSLRTLISRPFEPAGTRFKLKAFFTWTASAGLCSVTPYIDRVDIADFAAEVTTPTLGQFVTMHAEGMHNTSPADFQHDGLAESTGVWLETEAVDMEELTQNFAVGFQFDVKNLVGGTVTVDVSQARLYAVRDDRTSYTP